VFTGILPADGPLPPHAAASAVPPQQAAEPPHA
jgi:hypothetical protein